ncbi:MAG: FHA domain-containing protein [Lachnospiraceae bacterium]|nr:FHA domain-containing protein [Lachnospiraceae bacterium]
MKETMPEISFERSMNHNYMILSKCNYFGKKSDANGDYRTKMLLENRIPGLLPVTHRQINGESRYYYEINSLQSLNRLYDKTEIRCDALRRLLRGCVGLFERLEEYLLDGTQIIMKPELIYMDVAKMEPYFVCYPDYEGDVRLSFMELVDGLLARIDHTDESAVMLGYQIYRYTRNPNYVISEVGSMVEHLVADMASREAGCIQRDFRVAENRISCAENSWWTGADNTSVFDRDTDRRRPNVLEENQNRPAAIARDEETGTAKRAEARAAGDKRDLHKGFLCVLAFVILAGVAVGTRVFYAFERGADSEIYLFGAMGMALAGAVLFFVCHVKREQNRKRAALSDEEENGGDSWHDRTVDSGGQSFFQNAQRETAMQDPKLLYRAYQGSTSRTSGCSETVYLGDNAAQERVLFGRMDGKEVKISLDRLPMTVGKLADVSDFVICDTSVSKMHAQFEERDGKVYVRDLNSTNGTVHNGVLLDVNQTVALEPGDRLRFGKTSFTYC